MKKFSLPALLFVMALLLSCKSNQSSKTDSENEWIQLFNGKDLNDWIIKINHRELNDNYKNTFRVENGYLTVNYSEYDTFTNDFGHIFYKKPFSDYHLRTEYRFVGEQVAGGEGWALRNSGIMVHCQDPATMVRDQGFPICCEAQLLGGNGIDPRPTANLCRPGCNAYINGELFTENCTESSSETFLDSAWITCEMIVYHDSIIHHLINGDTVLTYTKPHIALADWVANQLGEKRDEWKAKEGLPLTEGYISLQSESHPIEFRKIELKGLTP